jgi:hypothetical protein
MKVTLEGSAFRDAMKTAAILFDAEAEVLATSDPTSGRLILETGRNGIYCKQSLEANVEEAGQIVLSCAHFAQLSFSDQVYLESDGKHVSFKSGRFKGTVAGSADGEAIEASRPEKPFKAKVSLPTEIFKNAVARVSFGSALPGAQSGIRIQAGEQLILSTTDGYRATIFKEQLAVAQSEFDVLLQPAFLHTALSRVQDLEVSLGVFKGTFRLKTDVLDIYHPAIQSTPDDIDEWITNGIDYAKRACQVKTTAEDFSKAIREVSSIHMGAVAYDTYVDLLIKGGKAHFRCAADHGSAQTSLGLAEVDVDKFLTKLSSRYALEMLNLAKAGEVEIGFWDAFLLISGASGKFKALIPTVAA